MKKVIVLISFVILICFSFTKAVLADTRRNALKRRSQDIKLIENPA